jgi:hypothetical protein
MTNYKTNQTKFIQLLQEYKLTIKDYTAYKKNEDINRIYILNEVKEAIKNSIQDKIVYDYKDDHWLCVSINQYNAIIYIHNECIEDNQDPLDTIEYDIQELITDILSKNKNQENLDIIKQLKKHYNIYD